MKAVVTPKRHRKRAISCQVPLSEDSVNRNRQADITVIEWVIARASLEEGTKRARTTLKRQAKSSPEY